ncbi:hypothetical protein KFE25_001222 [Diacronema lutheri]|uniref:Major facilitator superfamily (MFS) profile domain-containing protein n=2 Tax=Diacronema lutheri TaxID=2081491 RepID=A0A8J6CBL8_DIALT|nr:hypothetical protein KFE25_001222 [Diacronema lutheri]
MTRSRSPTWDSARPVGLEVQHEVQHAEDEDEDEGEAGGDGAPDGARGKGRDDGARAGAARAERASASRGRMAVVLSGLGLMTDVYDLQVINLARPLIALEHRMSAYHESLITSAAIVGAIVGMVAFGALADRLGRRAMFLLTALLTTLGAVASACARASGPAIYAELAAWRFVMGVGIGGEYPLSAANSAEHGGARGARGGRQVALTYSMMGWGGLLAPLVFLALQLLDLPPAAVWRLGFAVGGAMSAMGALLRALLLSDSRAFVAARAEGLAQSVAHGGYVRRLVASLRGYWRPLLGSAGCWLLFDIYEYGLNLYTSDILHAAGLARPTSPLDATLGVLALRLCTIPGYLGSIPLIATVGRRQTLDWGFASIGCAFFALGALWAQMVRTPALFLALFGLAQVLDNAGCNAATYVIPAEIFPSQMRATCHGASAAAGKVGAAVGSAAFPLVVAAVGLRGVFLACAAICALGLALSVMTLPRYDDAIVAGIDEAHAAGGYLEHLYAHTDGGAWCARGCGPAAGRRAGGAVRLADERGVELGATADVDERAISGGAGPDDGLERTRGGGVAHRQARHI